MTSFGQNEYPVTYSIPKTIEAKPGGTFVLPVVFKATAPWYICSHWVNVKELNIEQGTRNVEFRSGLGGRGDIDSSLSLGEEEGNEVNVKDLNIEQETPQGRGKLRNDE